MENDSVTRAWRWIQHFDAEIFRYDMIMAVVDDDEFMMTEVDHDYNDDGAEMMKPMTIMPTTMLLVLTSLLLPEASSTR